MLRKSVLTPLRILQTVNVAIWNDRAVLRFF